MLNRLRFDFATAGDPVSDTGPAVYGEIHQVVWRRASGDTGGEVELTLLPDADDTGSGVLVLRAGLVPAGWIKFPRYASHDPDGGGDTGAAAAEAQPVVACFERLRATLTPGNTGATGRLWVWVK
jgi:hypothetical protein